MIPNYKEIFDSWVTSLNPNETQKKIAQERLDICKGCEYRKEMAKGIKWSSLCVACGCPLSKKVFSPLFNPCPKQKWDQVDIKYSLKLIKKDKKTII